MKLKDLVSSREGPIPSRLLAIDPGETIGWATFLYGELLSSGQHRPTNLAAYIDILFKWHPVAIAIERFALYPWKAAAQSFSTFPTVQVVGAIKYVAQKQRIPLLEIPAAIHKTFFKDKRLRNLGLYVKGRHARDAVRVGAYFLVFRRKTLSAGGYRLAGKS